MVKVEKKGRLRYVYCEDCDSILSFSKQDKKWESGEDWYNEYIICPECGKKVIILQAYTIGGVDYKNKYYKKRIEYV